MRQRLKKTSNVPKQRAKYHNGVAKARSSNAQQSVRARGTGSDECLPFTPPEDWYEPGESVQQGYRIVSQSPGTGFRHVVTAEQVRRRLDDVPQHFLEKLEVVQLSRMTRKKCAFPCYGMQWGPALYLYPIEESLIEEFGNAPPPALYNETRMYGGRWEQDGHTWRLVWTPETIRDYYLNNILIHELGHLLDDRNSSYIDRERYAEWFAIEYGYRPTQPTRRRWRPRKVVRRHAKT